MKDLLSELVQARYRAAGGAMVEAREAHHRSNGIARRCVEPTDRPKISTRAVRGFLTDAKFFLQQGHSDRAVDALGSDIEMLEPKGE